VPYIHCPECRLTVYGGIAYKKKKRCPRCGTEMAASPRPLFRSLGSKRPRPPAPPSTNALADGGQFNAS
jgi:hypothetical protein